MEQYYDLQKATLIKADGTVIEMSPKGKNFTYEEMRDAIGNIIEPIILRYWTNHKDYKKMNFICDEEGAINGSSYNKKATELLKKILGANAQELYGNVIFLPNKLFRL